MATVCDRLVDDLWYEVYRCLDLTALVHASRVCRAWQTYAHDPGTWENLVLPCTRIHHELSHDSPTVGVMLERWQRFLRSRPYLAGVRQVAQLDAAAVPWDNIHLLRCLQQHLPRLECFRAGDFQHFFALTLTDAGWMSTEELQHEVLSVLAGMPCLRTLHLYWFSHTLSPLRPRLPQLTALHLYDCTLPAATFEEALSVCENLTELALWYVDTVIPAGTIHAVQRTCGRHLTRFTLNGDSLRTESELRAMGGLVQLTHLLWTVRRANHSAVGDVLRQLSRLEVLTLHDEDDWPGAAIEPTVFHHLRQCSSTLTCLSLHVYANNPGLQHPEALRSLCHLPHLMEFSLYLASSAQVLPDHVLAQVAGLSHLKLLRLGGLNDDSLQMLIDAQLPSHNHLTHLSLTAATNQPFRVERLLDTLPPLAKRLTELKVEHIQWNEAAESDAVEGRLTARILEAQTVEAQQQVHVHGEMSLPWFACQLGNRGRRQWGIPPLVDSQAVR